MSGAPPVELAIRCATDYSYLFFSPRFRLKNEHAQQFEDCMAREAAELERESA